MALAVGTDLVSVARIAAVLRRHPERFQRRCFRSGEQTLARRGGSRQAAALAALWAAKEAVLKALGSANTGVGMLDIEVVGGTTGSPSLQLHGAAAAALSVVGGKRIRLTLGDAGDSAVALVIIE